MRGRLYQFLVWLPATAAGIIAAAIILLSMLAVRGLQLPFISPGETGAVQNYVLFTHVETGIYTVTTGAEYVSTTDMRVARQWCYAQRGDGDRSVVQIADADASGTVSFQSPSADTLAFLGLSQAAVRDLADRHCRFLQ